MRPGFGAWAQRGGVSVAAALGLAGCELTEVTLAEPEDVLVAEAYVRIGDGTDQVTAFLHWTNGTGDPATLFAAEVVLLPEEGETIPLFWTGISECLQLDSVEEGEVGGVCFAPVDELDEVLSPGIRVGIQISLPDGRVIEGETDIPEDIQLIRPQATVYCGLPPGRNLDFVWNQSEGAWAYSAEAEITGLRLALEPQGIEVEEDSIYLLGLAVSEADTSIAFPREFGVFSRFDLQQEVGVALQAGLPQGAHAVVAIAALDKNYVNWVRGGNFNPSGAVRISSLRGDGVGVFASAVRRSIEVLGIQGSGIPPCIENQ